MTTEHDVQFDPHKLISDLPLNQLKTMAKLLEIKENRLTFAQDFHINTRGEKMNLDDYPHVKDLYNSTSPVIVLMGSVQSFKMLPDDANIHTPKGWVKNGTVKIGDIVSTPSGIPARIEGLQKFPDEQLYEFVLDDGRVIESGKDHLWKVLRRTRRSKISKGRKSVQWNISNDWEVLSTWDILNDMGTGIYRFSLPVPKPVEKTWQDVPLSPYFVGLMLGDGELTGNGTESINIRFSSVDPELVESINDILYIDNLEAVRYRNTCNYYFRRVDSVDSLQGPSWLREKFDQLGLTGTYSHTKFIPDCYKNGSVAQRLALLQGLMDIDGSGGDGGLSIRLSSEQLIKDIQEIVWSLGGMAKYSELGTTYSYKDETRHGKNTYLMHISLPNPKRAFRLERKRKQVSETHRRLRTFGPIIESVEKTRKADSTCIALSGNDHLYITNDYIVTHNTEWLIIDHFAAAYSGLSVFFVLPKYETRTTYVQNRINRCVESVPEYKKIIGSGFFDSVSLKNFGKGIIKYVGSNVLADFREFPADVLIVDEVDQCNQKHLELGPDRLRASPFQFKRFLANPSIKERGIHALFLESDQKEWHVPCSKCGQHSEVNWFTTVVEDIVDKDGNVVDYVLRDKDWKVGCGRDIMMICPLCGGQLIRESLDGKWVAKNPDSPIEGFHISMLCAATNSIAGMWQRFQAGLEDLSKLQKFYNSDLGLPFDPAGNKITENLLDGCVDEEFKFNVFPDYGCIPNDAHSGPCSMGIDVGSNFDVRISISEPKGVRRAAFIGKVKTLDDLLDLVERYNVELAVIDSMPEITLAQDFQDMASCDVWLCSYRSEGKDRKQTFDTTNRVIHIDRTEALDRAFSSLRKGKNVLPRNFSALIGGQFVSEMCLPVRSLVEDDRGNQKFEWSKGKDHQRHCDSYDLIADKIMRESLLDDFSIG